MQEEGRKKIKRLQHAIDTILQFNDRIKIYRLKNIWSLLLTFRYRNIGYN